MNYKTIKRSKEYLNDKNCCTVVASSIAFDVPFKKMQDLFFKHGRKRNRGYWMSSIIFDLAEKFNYKVDCFEKKILKRTYNLKTGSHNKTYIWTQTHKDNKELKYNEQPTVQGLPTDLTVNNCLDYLHTGNFIMSVSGHVACIKNGSVEDWSNGKKLRAQKLYRIKKS